MPPIPPVRANAGITMLYRRKLEKLVKDMRDSATYWIEAEYKRQQPRLAQDANPASELAKKIKEQRRRWDRIFNSEAEALSGWFVGRVSNVTTVAAKAALKKKLPTVNFDPSRAYNTVTQAAAQENVALIKSIQSKYFADVESAVLRSAAAGRDLKTLADELESRYKVTRSRAELIARDQNNKATAQMTKARHESLGIEYGKWKHSHAGKEPRKSHKDADGKVFKLSEGMYLEDIGKSWAWILPGWAINCRCTWEPLIPGLHYPVGTVPTGYKRAA